AYRRHKGKAHVFFVPWEQGDSHCFKIAPFLGDAGSLNKIAVANLTVILNREREFHAATGIGRCLEGHHLEDRQIAHLTRVRTVPLTWPLGLRGLVTAG